MKSTGALSGSREPSPDGLGPSGFDPERWLNTLVTSLLGKMLHPRTGVTRGLLDTDAPNKIIGVRVDELRQIALCLRILKREREHLASAIETRQGGDVQQAPSRSDESAARKAGDAQ